MSMAPESTFSAPTSTTSVDDLQSGLLKDANIPGLREWLASMSLEKHLPAAILWCHEQGAVSMKEVSENWQDVAEALNLKPLEKKRMERERNGALQSMTPPLKKAGSALGPTMATVSEDVGLAMLRLPSERIEPWEYHEEPDTDIEPYLEPYTDIEPSEHHDHEEPDTDIEPWEHHDHEEPCMDIEPWEYYSEPDQLPYMSEEYDDHTAYDDDPCSDY